MWHNHAWGHQHQPWFGGGIYVQRNARFLPTVDSEINGVLARLFELQLLNVDDEIARHEVDVGRQDDLHRHVDARHHETAILVHKIHFHLVLTFFDLAENKAERDRALRVNR